MTHWLSINASYILTFNYFVVKDDIVPTHARTNNQRLN